VGAPAIAISTLPATVTRELINVLAAMTLVPT
jgi:hypothetical protein